MAGGCHLPRAWSPACLTPDAGWGRGPTAEHLWERLQVLVSGLGTIWPQVPAESLAPQYRRTEPAGRAEGSPSARAWAQPQCEFREMSTTLARAGRGGAPPEPCSHAPPGRQLPSESQQNRKVPWLDLGLAPYGCPTGAPPAAPSPAPVGSQRATWVPGPRRGPFKCSSASCHLGQH